jgi:hypothetical protein
LRAHHNKLIGSQHQAGQHRIAPGQISRSGVRAFQQLFDAAQMVAQSVPNIFLVCGAPNGRRELLLSANHQRNAFAGRD